MIKIFNIFSFLLHYSITSAQNLNTCPEGKILRNQEGTSYCCQLVITPSCLKLNWASLSPPPQSMCHEGVISRAKGGYFCCNQFVLYKCQRPGNQKADIGGDEVLDSVRQPNLQCIGGDIENRREGAYCCFDTNTLYCNRLLWVQARPPPASMCTKGTVMRSKENYFCCRMQMVKNCNRIQLPRISADEIAADGLLPPAVVPVTLPLFCYQPEFYRHPRCGSTQ